MNQKPNNADRNNGQIDCRVIFFSWLNKIRLHLENKSRLRYETQGVEEYQHKMFGRPDEIEQFYGELLTEMQTGKVSYWKTNYRFYEWKPGSAYPRKKKI